MQINVQGNRPYRKSYEKDLVRLYLKEISKIHLLTVYEERELARRARAGDKEAGQRLVEANLRFVIKIARKFQKSGISLLDLINEGNLGLIEAVRKFDPNRNVRFLTYAVWWIRQAIYHYLSHQGKLIPVGSRIRHILHKLSVLSETELIGSEELGREAIAGKIGVTVEELERALPFARNIVSLETPLYEESEHVLGDTLPQKSIPSAEELVVANHMVQYLRDLMKALSEKEAKVLKMRFGLEEEVPMTLQEIGEQLGLSRERIRQIEVHSLDKLRHIVCTK